MNNNQQQENEKTVNLLELLRVLWDNVLLIVCGAVVLALAVYLFETFMVTPQYTSSTTILVLAKEQEGSRIDVNSLSVSSQLTSDYVQLITVRDVTEATIAQLDLKDEDGNSITHEALKKKLKVSRIADTRMITIEASDADPGVAKAIVETVRDLARDHIKAVVNAEAVNIVEQANVPVVPSSPHKLRDAVIGAAAGVMILCAVVIIAHIMDNTIKSSEDVEKYLNITALGVIPIEEELERSIGANKRHNRRGKPISAGAKR